VTKQWDAVFQLGLKQQMPPWYELVVRAPKALKIHDLAFQ
jgi:hypothetical protein